MRISLRMRISLPVVLQWSLQRSATLMDIDVHITLRCTFHRAYHGICAFHSLYPFLGLRKFFCFCAYRCTCAYHSTFSIYLFLGLAFPGMFFFILSQEVQGCFLTEHSVARPPPNSCFVEFPDSFVNLSLG